MYYNIDGRTIEHDHTYKIVLAAKKRLLEILEMKGLEDRTGCRLLIARVHMAGDQFSHAELLHAETIGSLTEAQEHKYTHYATEKALRLFSHLAEGHITSRQSACEAKAQYTGAIYTGTSQHIISVSGFPALADEAMATISAKDAGMINATRALVLTGDREVNPYYPRSFDK